MGFEEKIYLMAAGISEIPFRKDEKSALKKSFINRDFTLLKNQVREILFSRPFIKTLVHPFEIREQDDIISVILQRGKRIIADFEKYILHLSSYSEQTLGKSRAIGMEKNDGSQRCIGETKVSSKEKSKRINGFITYVGEDGYPELLSKIPDAPLVLFCVGESFKKNVPYAALVGARRINKVYFEKTLNLSNSLAEQGIVIVSGLAYGADSAAHLGALEAGGRTVAVLGTAINNVYPVSNHELKKRILFNKGTVISEYPVNAQSEKFYFSERNRIISGLSHVCIVARAALKSGSLVTARYAEKQGRRVYTYKGRSDEPSSQGCDMLISKGKAREIKNHKWLLNHLLEFFNSQKLEFSLDNRKNFIINKRISKKNKLSPIGRLIFENLASDKTVEALSDITGYSISQVGAAITELELLNYIKRDNRNNIIILERGRKRNGKNPDNC